MKQRFFYETKPTKELEKLTQDALALNTLGERYFYGIQDVQKNEHRAVGYYKKAVALGSAIVANHLAGCYVRGDGVKADPQEAEKWYTRSAALYSSLENRCMNNRCEHKVLCSLLLLAWGGNPQASLDVAHFYTEGTQGFPQDLMRAAYYLKTVERALEQGDTQALGIDQSGLEQYRHEIHMLRSKIQRLQSNKSRSS